MFGAVASLGELDELVVKLQGSPLLLRQASPEVARLQAPEAEQVFDALRARVRDAEDLAGEPAGARGLAEICRHHPFLRRSLLAFLKDLPDSKLGPWAVTGWTGTFDEADVKTEFDALLNDWAEQDENKKLKAAAKAAIKLVTRRGRR